MKSIHARNLLLFFVDVVTLCFSCILAFFLFNALAAEKLTIAESHVSTLIFILCNMIALSISGIYRIIWRYADEKDFLVAFASILVGSTACTIILNVIEQMPNGICMLLTSLLTMCMICGIRLLYQYVFSVRNLHSSDVQREPTMIVGSGLACRNLLSEMTAADCRYKPVCIVNDNRQKIGRRIQGVVVYGPTERIPELCSKLNIKNILFVMSSCDESERERIRRICTSTSCMVKVVPYIDEIGMDKNWLRTSGDIDIENLLGRKAIHLDNAEVLSFIRDEVCMVTGGGGSIGSELCRQIAKYHPKQLIIVDCYENNAYEIQQELIRQHGDSLNLSVQIASIRDFHKMDQIFKLLRPTIVFHAAAHKHVPLMETNPEEAVKNNVIGTYQLAKLASHYHVDKFVLVSTDKAVNPTNVMGATKRCCEMAMQFMTGQSGNTEFITVRFGNVLGSNGSVIPLFKKQIETGGPVTVTHPDIIRYFMTIPESVSLILQAGAMAHGGEIFVLDMGEPVRIVTLAENLIRQYGKEPYRDIKIEFTGLRPGEKLYEELLMSEEGLQSTMNDKLFIGSQIPVDSKEFILRMEALEEVVDTGDASLIIHRLHDIVPSFTHKELSNSMKEPLSTQDGFVAVRCSV